MKEIQFLVSTTSFELYTAFKNECEKIGWTYNHEFSEFSYENSDKYHGLFFSTHWSENDMYSPKFSFSNCSSGVVEKFDLDFEWKRAIDYAKEVFNKTKPIKKNTWGTFYGKKFKFSEMSHQHLSNIVHYYKYVRNQSLPPTHSIKEELNKRFGGIELPYHPLISFVSEIDYLKQEGYTTGEPDADIIIDGKWIGKILYK